MAWPPRPGTKATDTRRLPCAHKGRPEPLFDLFWTDLWISLRMLWVFLVISILVDIFRSKDLSGWATAARVFFVILVPLVGVLVI